MVVAAPLAFIYAAGTICVEQQRYCVPFGLVVFMVPDFARLKAKLPCACIGSHVGFRLGALGFSTSRLPRNLLNNSFV
jgi:hypothetical protein